MPENTPESNRSPLHPHALGVRDFWGGREVAVVDARLKRKEHYRVFSTPTPGQDWVMLVNLNPDSTISRPYSMLFCDMGVVPYPFGIGWHPDHVTLDANDCRSSIPACDHVPNPRFSQLLAAALRRDSATWQGFREDNH